ncbi:hypothetical protein [Bordetella petrii]|uniref:hypothetical protein n=1 Tax=Bordetella petrii TaxID=94624 RepID=UPI0037316902
MPVAAANPVLLIDSPVPGQAFAFGVSWFALVGSHPQSMARARARRQRATHYVVGGQGAVAGGCARLAAGLRRRPVHAAAQAFAAQHPDGTAACIAQLPDGRWWLVAAQDGAVLARTDRLYDDVDAAAEALRTLNAQHPSLRQCDGAAALAAVLAEADSAALMSPVRSRWALLPLPVRAFAVGLAAALVVPPAWQAWSKPPRQPVAVPAMSAEAAWALAAEQFRRSRPVHSLGELSRVLASLHRLPLGVQGWLLREAHCQPGSQAWACRATYARQGVQAANDDFARAVPAGWGVHFRPLDTAEVSWTVVGDGATLATAVPPGAVRVERDLASVLQRARPAFNRLTLGPAVAVDIPPPRDPHGYPLAAPPMQPATRQRLLALEGPLRSLALLADQPLVVAWSSLALRLAAGRSPGLAVSALTAELQGVLYEQD